MFSFLSSSYHIFPPTGIIRAKENVFSISSNANNFTRQLCFRSLIAVFFSTPFLQPFDDSIVLVIDLIFFERFHVLSCDSISCF